MNRIASLFLYCFLLAPIVLLWTCENSQGKDEFPRFVVKGDSHYMRTHFLGRFSVAVPVDMNLAVQTNSFRRTEITEFLWVERGIRDEGSKRKFWKEHLAAIKRRDLPEGIKDIIIDTREFHNIGKGASGVFYYGNSAYRGDGYWDILLDTGVTGVWLKYHGRLDAKDLMLHWVLDIAKAYRPGNGNGPSGGNLFHLVHGAIDLPYKRQERTYSRFEGHPLNLKLEIEMQETHHVERAGLLERLGAAIATRYAPGVDVDRVRGQKRTIAGLQGEDVVVRMKDRHERVLTFAWEYSGEENSGERPEIQITMESPDGALEEKIKVWDAILDSFKPMYPIRK